MTRSFRDVIVDRHTKILLEAMSNYAVEALPSFRKLAMREAAYSYNVLLSLGKEVELPDELMAELILRRLV